MSEGALATGLRLTWMGMGLVFLLLAALWALIALLLRLDRARPAVAVAAGPAAAPPPEAGPSAETLAVIYAAARLHRRALRQRAAPEVRVHPPGSLPSRWVGSGRARTNRSFAPRGGRR